MYEAKATWIVEDHEMHVETCYMNHPTIAHGHEFNLYLPITAHGLYGFLRSYSPDTVLLVSSDPIWIAIYFDDILEETHYFQIGLLEYRTFQNLYMMCEAEDYEKVNWLKEGF